jgi:hypothetical protein
LYLKRALFGKDGYLEWCACELPKGHALACNSNFPKKKKNEEEDMHRTPQNFSSAGVLFMT